jgi:thiol:disulfide interchange protein DsbC
LTFTKESTLSFIQRIIAAALLAIAASAANAGEAEDRLRAILIDRLPGLQIESIRKLPQADLYEVVHNGRRILYADPNGEVGLFGNLIELKSRTNLTEQRQNELNVVDFSKLPLDKAIKKVKGKGSRRMAVFTDPDCPFCKRLENELKNVDDVTIYVFLLPLEQLHPDAPRKARAVWCAPDPVKAWDALMMEGKDPPAAAEGCKDPIAEVAKLANDYNIQGTPGLIFESGRLVPGAIGAKQIEEELAAARKS